MKATGIVRRVDELGRIVLPIELRRTLSINVGDGLEVFSADDGLICLRKYAMNNSEQSLKELKSCVMNDTNLGSESKRCLIGKIGEIEVLMKSQEVE